GVIRTRQGRNIFFHAGDLEGVKFQDLACGESVTFELIEDSVSGPRAAFIRPSAARAGRGRVPDGTTV
ncbi:MAG: cold shock domain-containing protein, partial [Acidobacteria bacterium]|nr:cold shock domain-containing protein [Acidobacteriota bacterium]